jgi:hypothetical protein
MSVLGLARRMWMEVPLMMWNSGSLDWMFFLEKIKNPLEHDLSAK